MIQVLGLRDFRDEKKGVTRKREVFFPKGWRFDSIDDVFNRDKLDAVLDTVPLEERYNLYYTVADCFEEAGRKLREQWAIPFDIDDLELREGHELDDAEKVARVAAEVLGVPFEHMAVTFSGNGVQFFIKTEAPILSEDYFEQTRPHYGLLAKRIQNKLTELGLKGTVDVSVWSKARLMRLPETRNVKPGRPERIAKILNGTMVATMFDVVSASGITELEQPQHVSDAALKNYPKPDTSAVCAGCKFLVRCKAEPNAVSEPEYYAMTSILARLDNGRELTHEYAGGYDKYNHYETENKIDQALAASGPRTCKNIDSLWGQCQTCDYYGKVTSPIMIKSENYIASGDFGYRERKVDKKGNVTTGKPAYMDLVRTFELENPYRMLADSDTIYVYDGRKWKPMPDPYIKAWAMQKIRPEPQVSELNEFVGILKAFHVMSLEQFYQQSEGFTPFKNVVLHRETGKVLPHAPEFGFFHTLNFDYDPRAKAPRWEKFLEEIMAGNMDLAQLLKEFGGYCISGDPCWLQKSLMLVGDGANGKSVFMEILGEVAGHAAHSAIPMQSLNQDTMRYHLVNKLFNYSEETSVRALSESDVFKTLVVGGMITVKQLYIQPYQVFNRAKIILSANDIPSSSDKSHGLYRRLIIVNFIRQFNQGDTDHDPFLKDKLMAELPGICNSLMEAYAKVQATRVLSAGEDVKRALDTYKRTTDTVQMFYDNHLELSDIESGHSEKIAEVYETYRMMCDMSGFKPVHVVQFGKQLCRINPSFEERRGRSTANGIAVRVYKGTKLNKEF